MSNTNPLIAAIARAAADWRDPDYLPRAGAVERTLVAPNRCTEEATAFAINQQMSLLTDAGLHAWLGERKVVEPQTVGVLHSGATPMDGLKDLLAIVLLGHRYLGSLPPESPFLLPAFVDELRPYAPDISADFVSVEDLLSQADALIATVTDEETDELADDAEAFSINPSHLLLRGTGFGVAVLDGNETTDDLEGIAEDALLHEGLSRRNVSLIWAPRGLAPDAFLESLAAFRTVFPPHPDTPGALKMQQAFLEAIGQSHAYGEGLEFLLSRGEADVQGAGHLRWVEYGDLEEVATWLASQQDEIQVVITREEVARALPQALPLERPGSAHRPALTTYPDGIDTVAFIESL